MPDVAAEAGRNADQALEEQKRNFTNAIQRRYAEDFIELKERWQVKREPEVIKEDEPLKDTISTDVPTDHSFGLETTEPTMDLSFEADSAKTLLPELAIESQTIKIDLDLENIEELINKDTFGSSYLVADEEPSQTKDEGTIDGHTEKTLNGQKGSKDDHLDQSENRQEKPDIGQPVQEGNTRKEKKAEADINTEGLTQSGPESSKREEGTAAEDMRLELQTNIPKDSPIAPIQTENSLSERSGISVKDMAKGIEEHLSAGGKVVNEKAKELAKAVGRKAVEAAKDTVIGAVGVGKAVGAAALLSNPWTATIYIAVSTATKAVKEAKERGAEMTKESSDPAGKNVQGTSERIR